MTTVALDGCCKRAVTNSLRTTTFGHDLLYYYLITTIVFTLLISTVVIQTKLHALVYPCSADYISCNILYQEVIQENNLGVSRGGRSKPNRIEASLVQPGVWQGGAVLAPSSKDVRG